MANFARIETESVFAARLAEKIIRPALFLYLNWPTGEVRATTHHKSVTTLATEFSPAQGETWTGVGHLASVEAPDYKRSGALMSYKVGLTSLPQDAVDDQVQASAIGSRAILYLGLADTAWGDWRLKQVFIGHVISAGDFRHRRVEGGHWVTDASIEISNGRSPRRHLQNHHSPETAETGDTAWRLLPTVGRSVTWPN